MHRQARRQGQGSLQGEERDSEVTSGTHIFSYSDKNAKNAKYAKRVGPKNSFLMYFLGALGVHGGLKFLKNRFAPARESSTLWPRKKINPHGQGTQTKETGSPETRPGRA